MAERDPEIMQMIDGELTPTEAAEVEGALGRDPALRGKAEGIRELTELVRGHLELTADAAAAKFDAVWQQIEKRIEHDRAPAAEPARASAAAIEAAAPAGVLARFGRWLDRHRGHIMTGVVSAGAVAAVALVLRGRSDDRDSGSPSISGSPVVEHVLPVVESLDVPEGSSTVFTIEDDDGDAAVIWVTPDDTVEGL